jgi:signal transduction histidine kinase
VVLLFPAALGAVVRFSAREQAREIDQVRSREREKLARELHDTVAHHVSAIAVQAQAGRAVAGKEPQRAVETLAVVEEAASRTLTEMREIVGALRDQEVVELTPQKGLADLEELKKGAGPQHGVELELSGDLDGLRPAVEAALYRMAQEAITNAVRHAKNTSGIWIRVHGEAELVRLTVTDDGEGASRGSDEPGGFGLRGLAERAALLGGTFEAGAGAGRGWRVEAVLPKVPGQGAKV